MSSKQEDEEVVMTPLRAKEGKVMKVERVKSTKLNKKTVQHVAGGPYKGIIINKAANEIPDIGDPDTLRDFACYIADPNSKENLIKEKRQLRFWFRSGVDNEEVEKLGEAFFQEVINPNEFPKDYIGYIKRIIVLLRMFPEVKKMELEMRPPRPGEDDNIHTIRHQVTRITRKVITTPGGRGQEDIHQYEDGEYDTSGGNLENGHSSSSSTPHGASLDRSARNVPSQDDQHRQHGRRGVDGGHIEDGYEDSVSATAGGAARWKKGKTQEDRHRQHGQNGTYEDEIEQEFSVTSSSTPLGASRGRRDPTQDDHLRQAGYHGAGQDSINSQYTNSVSGTPYGREQEDSTKIKLSKHGQMIIWIAKKQRILNVLEDAYPDILSCDDLIRLCHYKKSDIITVAILLNDLKNRGLINEVTKGRYMRVQTVTKTVKVEEEGVEVIQTTRSHEVKVVQQVPILSGREQPTIAIITLLYCEKLAVDAMMVDKTTYVKYKTEGEGQVYTLGKIGKHKVVSTKLSRIGYGEGAQVAAGNYVTRLLGTFNKIEHAFLLGVGGGIPNFRDDRSHVRLGDIVVSKPDYNGGPLYTMCTGVDEDPSGGMSFNTQTWNTRSDQLQKIINKVEEQQKKNPGGELEWETYLEEGFNELEGSETRFFRPPPETDRLYKVIDGQLVEVLHPEPAKGSPREKRPNVPVVHYAGIGAGKKLLKDESLKMDFGMLNEVKAIDPGFQAVMESIDGNRTESFAIIRGVSDYADGMSRKEWHPFASLAAASFMKSIIKAIPVPDDD